MMSDYPMWRKTIQAAAREAAQKESHIWSKDHSVAFNYRWEHVQSVVHIAVRLADLTGADRDVVEAAAWLHDIAKAHDTKNHAQNGAVAASQILAATDFPREKVEAVADAIAKHAGLVNHEPVEPLEAAVLWDADKLSKLGATAVLHFVGLKVALGRETTAQLLHDLPGSGWQDDTVRSFTTAPARAAGRKRWDLFRSFCQQALQELEADDVFPDSQGLCEDFPGK